MSEQSTKELLLRAALEVRTLKAKIAELERQQQRDQTVVLGLSGRFPGANSIDRYWQLLLDGIDATSEAPTDRPALHDLFDPDPDRVGRIYTRRGGFIDSALQFDPSFFGIPTRDAKSMDPQHALLLQVTWEALEDAGICADDLRHARVGVFIGITSTDFGTLTSPDDPYGITGIPLNAAAGRISHVLGLRGPALALDTACSSSLVAIHLAHRSLQAREVDVAIAGGVNLLLAPTPWLALSRSRALARDGRCKTFDASADGYGRGEGCGVVVMSRESDARSARRTPYGIVHGSAVNHNGGAAGMTVPSARAQEAVIREALEAAAVSPERIGYIEAHGTGTALGDPIEVRGLMGVFGSATPFLGTAKVNIGHLESASGVAGFIRALLCVEHGRIPPHLHLSSPNPHVPWSSVGFKIAQEIAEWSGGEPRLAGVSSFGASGTNAHIVVGQVAKAPRPEAPPHAHVIFVSGPSREALESQSRRLAKAVSNDACRLDDVAHTLSHGRHHWEYRRAATVTSTTALAEALSQPLGPTRRQGSKLCLLFPGQGSMTPGAGRHLYERFAVYKSKFDEVAEAAREWKVDLVTLLKEASPESLLRTRSAQLLLIANELAMLALLQSCGVEASVVAGHSLGELAAAHAAHVLTVKEVVGLVGKRSELMERLPAGGMLSVFSSADALTALIERTGLEIAARNSRTELVVAGPPEKLQELAATLETNNIRHRRLAVTHAFHSSMMTPILDELDTFARNVTHREPRVHFVSAADGREFDRAHPISGAYWARQLRAPVRFDDAMTALIARGADVFVEVGPGTTLIGLIQRLDAESVRMTLPTLTRDDESGAFLQALGSLYEAGWSVRAPTETGRSVRLPTTPTCADRRPFWKLAWNRQSSNSEPRSEYGWARPIATEGAPGELRFHAVWNTRHHPLLGAHVVAGRAIVSAAFSGGFVRACLRAAGWDRVAVTAMRFDRPMHLQDGIDYDVEVILDGTSESGSFRVIAAEAEGASRDIASGSYGAAPDAAGESKPAHEPIDSIRARCDLEMDGPKYYSQMWSSTGQDVRGSLRRIAHYWYREGEALAELAPIDEAIPPELAGMIPPILWDEVMGQVARTAGLALRGREVLCLAKGARQASAVLPGAAPAFMHAIVTGSTEAGFNVDVLTLDKDGVVLASMRDLVLGFVKQDALGEMLGGPATDLKSNLTATAETERGPMARDFVLSAVRRILGPMGDAVGPDVVLSEAGMDSFSISVLRSSLHESAGVRLPVDMLLRSSSKQIADSLCETLFASGDGSASVHVDDTRWLVPLASPARPRARIVCFPGGGGGPLLFGRLSRELARDDVHVLAVQLPGREGRVSEAAPPDLETIRESILRELPADDDLPLILVGHSMGASLAYDLAANALPPNRVWHMVLANGPLPSRLGPIGNGWDDAQREYLIGGLSELYGREAALRLVANDRVLTELAGTVTSARLPTPVTLVWGEHDTLVGKDEIEAWRSYFSGPVDLQILACGHNPPTEAPEALGNIIRSQIRV